MTVRSGDRRGGSAAATVVGTSAGTVAAGDDSRIVGAAQKTANLSDLASSSTARTNLGLGGAAVAAIGTTAGTVAAGNDSRFGPAPGSDTWLKFHAGLLDGLITGTVTRDASGAATSASVVWPDGTPGTYTATTVSAAFPGAVDAYTVTYGSPVTKTVTQPAVTRNSAGAVTARPGLTVS